MLKLNVLANGIPVALFDLRPGINRLGRNPDNDIVLDDPSISGHHCEIVVDGAVVFLRDLGSSNGSFVDGVPAQETMLQCGQTLQFGVVEAGLTDDEVRIAIPLLPFQQAPLPTTLPNGRAVCQNHPSLEATLRCTRCGESFCDVCVHQIRRVGGAPLLLCPACSHRCEPIPGLVEPQAEERSPFGRWVAQFTQRVRCVFLGR